MVTFCHELYIYNFICLHSGVYYKRKYKQRLPGYDYSAPGTFFITIDCYRMECHFGEIIKTEMMLSDFGKIAFDLWSSLSSRFPCFESHIFQIMPNHLHSIVEIKMHESDSNGYPNFQLNGTFAGASPASTQSSFSSENLSNIIGAYKSLVANACLEFHKEKFSYKNNLVYRQGLPLP